MTGRRRRRKSDPNRPGHGARYHPLTAQVGRCRVCGHLYDRYEGDDGKLCLSCRKQPPLFTMGGADI